MSVLIIPELFGEALTFLDFKDLWPCELICRRVRRMIEHRKLWRMHFEARVQKEYWCWPRGETESINWKTFFCRYSKEIRVRQSLTRNVLSGRFVWRCIKIWDHLTKALDTHRSRSFYLGSMKGEKLKWKILFQRLVRDNEDHLGIFLQQKSHAIRCFFSLSVLGENGKAVSSHSCSKQFQGGLELDHSTCGWLFSLDSLSPVLEPGGHELVVELDLTVFPNELEAVEPLFQLITAPDTSEELRRITVSSLGDFVTHFAPNPSKAKQYLQELDGGPLPLINLLDDPTSKAQIRSAAAGALWNILDTSKICISPELVFRMVNAACVSLHNLFARDKAHRDRERLKEPQSSSSSEPFELDLDDEGPLLDDEDLNGELGAQLRDGLVNALTGLMWNIPIVNDFRKMMAANKHFFPALFSILAHKEYQRTHFTCLHLISTLHHYDYLPPNMAQAFQTHLTDYIQSKETICDVIPTDVGVLLSLRDVADFFVPLLRSNKLECVNFGQWCMKLFYFKTPTSI